MIFNHWTKYEKKEVLEIAKLPPEEYKNMLKLAKIRSLRIQSDEIEKTLSI
jgi:hypothetical protein